MTIYRLMNEVSTLRWYMTLAKSAYRDGKCYYRDYEDMCRASFETLEAVGYLDEYDIEDLREQMYHVMRLYKGVRDWEE